MIFPYEEISKTESDTNNIASEFSSEILPGDLICLNGELGAGKTFFAKALMKNFGIINVNSPSFAIVNEYKGNLNFNHFDFYRIKNINELYDIGINEYLLDEQNIKLIEWSDLFPEVLPTRRFEIHFEILNSNERKITIRKIYE